MAAVAVFDAAVLAAVNAVNVSVQALNTSVSSLLYQIGTAINQQTSKVSSTVEAAARAQREFDTAQERNRRYEDARQRYSVPSSICSESTSGGAAEVAAAAAAAKGAIRPRGGVPIADSAIAQAVNSPQVPQEVDAARASKVHAQFCDADDHAAYGGSKACPAISTTMPGADKRVDSLYAGAGPNGKTIERTFSQPQIDAALMYIQNAYRRSVGPQLRKGEAETTAGAQYVGLVTQFNAVLSAATDPAEQQISDSTPNPATQQLLKEAFESPSAKAYFDQVASPRARSTNVMSAREFEFFEVGRRYANTAYQADLQSMAGDNLARELIRVNTLNAWLLAEIKTELRRGNIITGQLLASSVRQEYEPILTQKYRAVSGRVGGGQ
ncbi:conjugal transfer protein TraW [Azohydromonas lata]|uniref:conjugal transfer protein TraW n=1 Tax=Azohydromonas lata TaxID=45677 RepID=UPI0012F48C31|nr:conjugal transfer protein TraW [Azohydromonas lata]